MQFFLTDFSCTDSKPLLCGLTENGETVAVQAAHMPYAIYVEPPINAENEECTRGWFNSRIRPFLEKNERVSKYFRPSLHLVHMQKLCGYSAGKSWCVKAIYDNVADAKRDAYAIIRKFKLRVYHHNLDPNLLFAAHTGIRCFSWIHVSLYKPVTTGRKSNCDIEVMCDVRNISLGKDEDKPPPHMRMAAFDIETDGLDWKGGDEIRMISVSCGPHDFLLTRHPICMDPAPGYCVVDCDGEIDLIKKFVDVIAEIRCVFLAGWNSMAFDTPFIFERARILGCEDYLQNLSWFPTRKLNAVMKEMSSNAYGQNRIFHDDLLGLLMIDGYILARKSVKVPSYTLKAFGEWVGAAKGDVTYMEMVTAFQTKDPRLLREVADYCVQDSRLVPKILLRMEEPQKVMAMTRLASVPSVYTIKRGTSILTFGLILAEAFKRELVVNPPPKVEGQSEGYQGATVIDPIRGYHKDPVTVLDFESLYPSIMRAFNICVSTFIKSYDPTEEVPSEYTFPDYSVIKIDGGFTAVFKRGVEGVFPSILRVLLDHRKAVKKQMKSLEVGTVAYNQANAKQLSLKIASNSMYGYLGAPTSQLYEKALAASVTSMGRQSLFQVRTTIENLCKEGRIPPDVHVVYGDSVTGDTPLLIREKGRICIKCIDEIEGDWEEYHGSKEAFVPRPPIQVWQDGGFTAVRRVIRHTTKKSIKRVMTPVGMVDCTEDHSLVRKNGTTVSPNTTNLGDELLHHDDALLVAELTKLSVIPHITPQDAFEAGIYGAEITPEILCGPLHVVRAYWDGFGHEDGFYSKKVAAGLFLLARRMGMSCHISPYDETSNLVSLKLSRGDVGLGGETIEYIGVVSSRYEDHVYDLETASHHFGVMPGTLVVHNTDSVMVKFPGLTPPAAYEMSKFLEEECTKVFVSPMRLEFECLFVVYLLENKKRYAGRVWSPDGGEPETVIKGLSIKRRDFPTIVQDGLSGILDILLGGGDSAPQRALEFIESVLNSLGTNQVAIEQLCITKELNRSSYKTPPPHMVVSRKMAARNPRDPPKSGDRITYVVLQGSGNVSEKAEDFVYVRDQLGATARFDLGYYATQLTSQCENMMKLCGMGAEFQAMAKKYVMMATLFTQKQHNLSHFFATTENEGSKTKKRIAESVPKESCTQKKQSSLDKWFGSKK